MITFKKYITEEATYKTVLSLEDAFELVRDHCSIMSSKFESTGQMFYRGSDNQYQAALGNSTAGKERTSANTHNYFTWWHDNDPAWSKYPKRSRSFICSTYYHTASNYGDVHLVIPYDNANIAIMPENDLFDSFDGLDPTRASSHSGGLSTFNDYITNLIKYNNLGQPSSYEELVKILKKIDSDLIENTKGKFWGEDDEDHCFAILRNTKSKNFYEAFKVLFKPDKVTQFHPSDAKLNIPEDKELYIQGKVVFLDPYLPEVKEFIKEQGWKIED